MIVLQSVSWFIFLMGTMILGTWLRKNPAKKNAENASRVLHFLFWVGVGPPIVWGAFNPGLSNYDQVLGLPPLPRYSALFFVGFIGLMIGMAFILASNVNLWFFGKGANAFFLTRKLVVTNIYAWTRNPMSLGLYMVFLGTGLLVRSTSITLGTLLVLVPVHIFFLKYFEEKELELRIGLSYLDYKKRVPFLFPRLFSRKD